MIDIDVTELDPVTFGVDLARLEPDHALVVAARLALELIDRRSDPTHDDYSGGRYHRANELPAELPEVLLMRWPPNGSRDEFVEYGPDGPPAALEVAA